MQSFSQFLSAMPFRWQPQNRETNFENHPCSRRPARERSHRRRANQDAKAHGALDLRAHCCTHKISPSRSVSQHAVKNHHGYDPIQSVQTYRHGVTRQQRHHRGQKRNDSRKKKRKIDPKKHAVCSGNGMKEAAAPETFRTTTSALAIASVMEVNFSFPATLAGRRCASPSFGSREPKNLSLPARVQPDQSAPPTWPVPITAIRIVTPVCSRAGSACHICND
jgi:hypothetical protein